MAISSILLVFWSAKNVNMNPTKINQTASLCRSINSIINGLKKDLANKTKTIIYYRFNRITIDPIADIDLNLDQLITRYLSPLLCKKKIIIIYYCNIFEVCRTLYITFWDGLEWGFWGKHTGLIDPKEGKVSIINDLEKEFLARF